MRIHTVAMVYVLIFARFFQFTRTEYAILIITIAMVLAAEAFNTSLERIANKFAANISLHIFSVHTILKEGKTSVLPWHPHYITSVFLYIKKSSLNRFTIFLLKGDNFLHLYIVISCFDDFLWNINLIFIPYPEFKVILFCLFAFLSVISCHCIPKQRLLFN